MKKSTFKLIYFFSALCFSFFSGMETGYSSDSKNMFKHSDVAVMYNVDDLNLLKKYKIDIIAWGGQIGLHSKKKIAARKYLFEKYQKAGLLYYTADMALNQEGCKYITCGDDYHPACIMLSRDLRKDNKKAWKTIKTLGIDYKNRAVLDIEGNPVGVPWLKRTGIIPMPCVNNPDLKEWLGQKVDLLLQTRPRILHFDEPLIGALGVLKNNIDPGCFCNNCCEKFMEFLKTRPEFLWEEQGISTLEGFNYRNFIKSKDIHPAKAPLWDNFVNFQLLSAAQIIKELRDQAKMQTDWPILISANASPGKWCKLAVLPYLDFVSAEVSHQAKTLKVPDSPLLCYKMGDSTGLPVFSTAFGSDWAFMRQHRHPFLVCAWIAQSYALGHYMMFPLKAWAPGSAFKPVSDHYACMANWIKDINYLLDNFKPVSNTALVISLDALRRQRDKKKIVGLCSMLTAKGITYDIIFEGNALLARDISATDFDNYNSIIVGLPEYLSTKAKETIRELSWEKPVWMAKQKAISEGIPVSIQSQIRITGADGVFCLPRTAIKKGRRAFVMHLLNRDYDSELKKMEAKGPFTVTIENSLLNNCKFSKAVLHQPVLMQNIPDNRIFDISEHIPLKQDSAKTIIDIPSLDLWSIVEFIY